MKILQDAMTQYSDGMKGRSFPPCFKGIEEYEYWLDAEGDAGAATKGLRKWVCRDCSVSFQKKCVTAKTCLIPLIPVEKIIERRSADDFDSHLVPWEDLESSKDPFQQSLYPNMFDIVMGVIAE